MTDSSFSARLAAYKKLIDDDIDAYVRHARANTRHTYGQLPADVSDVFFDLLTRGGKRIRGTLAIVGYEMCGGTDRTMIVRAATALEMVNTYILMIDDIQDRSLLRRGKATAHMMLADYSDTHRFKGDAGHTGVSLTLNAALAGNHAAQTLLAGLSVDADLRMKVLGIVNQAMVVTAHGQTQDITNALRTGVDGTDIAHVLEWKTAYYSFLNPLCVGMVLAGAGCEDTDAIRAYALPVGRAFQVTDDIIGTFGNDKHTGKHSMDDIREGKQTMLSQYALSHAPVADREFLAAALGNDKLTEAAFARCQQIMVESGALDHARRYAAAAIDDALSALHLHQQRWQPEAVAFLRELASAMINRTA